MSRGAFHEKRLSRVKTVSPGDDAHTEMGAMGAVLDRCSRALAHRRAPFAMLGLLALVPLTLLTRSGPVLAPLLDGRALLAPPITIVDPSLARASQLATVLAASGVGVDTVTPDLLAQRNATGAYWLTEEATTSLGLARVEAMIATGASVFVDGDTAVSRSLLRLAPYTNADRPRPALADDAAQSDAVVAVLGFPAADSIRLLGGGVVAGLAGGDVPSHPSSQPVTVREATMRGTRLHWDVDLLALRPTIEGSTLAVTSEGSPALFLRGDRRVLWSLPSLTDGAGLARLPYLPQVLSETWGITPRVERHGFDLYVDPDEEGHIKAAELVRRWEAAGVRRVYFAAWKQNADVGWRYDYGAIVRAAHARRIEVYAWLEWPYVDFSFWRRNPDCRERTADGLAAKINWRELVAVEVPDCFDRAWKQTRRILNSAKFDGVNVSDLTFESPYFGPREPKYFTPFHPLVRQDFIRAHGFDPVELTRDDRRFWKRNPSALAVWSEYRVQLLIGVYDRLLSRLQTVRSGRNLVVSLMDDRVDPSIGPLVRDNSGQATRALMSLRDRHPFQLQLRDPVPFRSQQPLAIVSMYAPSRPAEPILGVDTVRRSLEGTGYVTERPTGIELYGRIRDAAAASQALAVFGTGAVPADDLGWIKHALVGGSVVLREQGRTVRSQSPVAYRLHLNGRARRVDVDGRSVGGGEWVDVPAGAHVLAIR